MREVLGAGRGVQAGEVATPAMAAEAGRETRRGAESDEESDGCDGAQDSARVWVQHLYVRANFMHLVVPKLKIFPPHSLRKSDKTVVPSSFYDFEVP